MRLTRPWHRLPWLPPSAATRCRTARRSDRTDWHNVIFYRGLAKVVEKYVHKGDKLYVEGRLRYRSYDDKKGMRRYVTEIYADNMELLTPRSAHDAAAQAAPACRQGGWRQTGRR